MQLRKRLDGQKAYTVRRKSPEQHKAPPPPEVQEAAIADVDVRHRVYSALLARLPLAPDHRENLLGRGLVDDELESVLKELVGLGVQHIMTCFDMDYMRNWHVKGAYGKLCEMLGGLNLTFGTYVWDPAYNGLDDYIWQFWMNKGELSHGPLEKA